MESKDTNAKPSLGFRETVFTQCADSFVRPEKPILRRNISSIEQNFGTSLTVNQSQPMKEHLPFNPKMQKIRNINISTKKDELSFAQKNKGEFFIDIYKESKKFEVAEKPNQVKFNTNNRTNEESFKKNQGFSNEKVIRNDKVNNSNSMKSVLFGGDNNDKSYVKKNNNVEREALLQATRNCPMIHKKNCDYKHIVASNGQIIYKE